MEEAMKKKSLNEEDCLDRLAYKYGVKKQRQLSKVPLIIKII